jgi:hypothetical protein
VRDIAASTASHPNVRDDREPPLFSGWDGETKSHISEKQKRIIFRTRAGQEFADTARRANHLTKKREKRLRRSDFLSFPPRTLLAVEGGAKRWVAGESTSRIYAARVERFA